ncbi:unnamed protein product [Symbiodinium sp. KB8]|nr:unnamed protein product [Symbiodinium sp. KB8]
MVRPGRWSQDEKVPWDRAEAKEEPGSEGDRPSEKPEGGWGGWSNNSWYARPSWSSWSWSYPSYGCSNYGYSSYSGWGDWNRSDAPVEAKQDDSQSRQERWSQAFAKDRQDFQDGGWWKSERDEQPKQEQGTPDPKQDGEGGQESKWVPPFESGSQEASAAAQEAKQASSDVAVKPSLETQKPRDEVDKESSRPAHENEEWYQKWLLRQKEKEQSGARAEPQTESFVTKAKKVEADEVQVPEAVADSDTHPAPAMDQEMSFHSMPEPESAPARHPHENEEWYQKWLRRQKNQPSHVIDIGAPQPQASTQDVAASSSGDPQASSSSSAEEKRVCPDDGKTYTFDELKKAYAGEYSDEDLKAYWRDAMAPPGAPVEKPAESKKEDYKQEEWYQKWLRRQQNKNRQIIEIG